MSTPDFLDSMNSTLPAREEVAETKPDPVTDTFEVEEEEDEQEEATQETDQASEQVEKPAATTAASESKEALGYKAGMEAERKKRQDLERKLKELESRQSAPAQVQRPKLNFYENPEQYIAEEMNGLRASYMTALEADQREQHEDFDEVAQLVVEAAQMNPQIVQRVYQAGNPARELYRVGVELREAQKQAELMKDPSAYKASIRDELKAELLAELRAELGEPAKPKVTLPRDLSNGRGGAEQVATTPPSDPRRGGFENLFDHRPRQT